MPVVTGSPCESVYKTGVDYVFLSNDKTVVFYEQLLKKMDETEHLLEESFTDNCTNTTVRMICHHILPPCGNSTNFKFPTFVCPSACDLQRKECPNQWSWFQQRLNKIFDDPLNCSHTEFLPNSILLSCSNLGMTIRKFKVLLMWWLIYLLLLFLGGDYLHYCLILYTVFWNTTGFTLSVCLASPCYLR